MDGETQKRKTSKSVFVHQMHENRHWTKSDDKCETGFIVRMLADSCTIQLTVCL
jgi:hypothetical protein